MSISVAMRQEVERKIVTSVIKAALAAGYTVSVDNGDNSGGEENADGEFLFELTGGTKLSQILKAMFLTDEDYLYFRNAKNESRGWVRFIYGEDGWDVINDYAVSLESLIGNGTATQKLIDKYAD